VNFSYYIVGSSCDLDLDPMTLACEHNLRHSEEVPAQEKTEVSRWWLSKVRTWTAQTDRQTDRRDRTLYQPRSQMVKCQI